LYSETGRGGASIPLRTVSRMVKGVEAGMGRVKKAHSFYIGMRPKVHLKRISISIAGLERALLEGSLGGLDEHGMAEEAHLEARRPAGVCGIDPGWDPNRMPYEPDGGASR